MNAKGLIFSAGSISIGSIIIGSKGLSCISIGSIVRVIGAKPAQKGSLESLLRVGVNSSKDRPEVFDSALIESSVTSQKGTIHQRSRDDKRPNDILPNDTSLPWSLISSLNKSSFLHYNEVFNFQ